MDILDYFNSLDKEDLRSYARIRKGLANYDQTQLDAFEGAVNTAFKDEDLNDRGINPETGVSRAVEAYIAQGKENKSPLGGKEL